MGKKFAKRIVVKVGSNVITRPDGLPDEERMTKLVAQIAYLQQNNVGVLLVSSGAVAAGRSLIQVDEHADSVAMRQQLAAVGQVKLIHTYATLFAKHNMLCAQVLVTKDDFRDRRHYLNMKGCVNNLMQNHIVPVVNENDVVSVTELMFTDNDELSALIASMIGADALILLTSVDGLYNGNPSDPDAELIPLIDKQRFDLSFISTEKTSFGRGGMLTKARMAHKLARVGITVYIANGKKDDILTGILNGETTCTKFAPSRVASGLKRWVASAEERAQGKLYINAGAHQALLQTDKVVSLLPVGITKIEGVFEKGDVVKIVTTRGKSIGLGIAKYDVDVAQKRIGEKGHPPLVHYDYLYLNGK